MKLSATTPAAPPVVADAAAKLASTQQILRDGPGSNLFLAVSGLQAASESAAQAIKGTASVLGDHVPGAGKLARDLAADATALFKVRDEASRLMDPGDARAGGGFLAFLTASTRYARADTLDPVRERVFEAMKLVEETAR